MKKNIIQTFIGILIGGIFLYLTLVNKPIKEILESIKTARLFWIIMSGIILLLTFYLRALRWKILLENTGRKVRNNTVFYSLILGYFINSFTPKLGEVIRCTSIERSEKVPVSTALGTVVSERIYDLLVLGAGLLILFILELKRLGNLLNTMFDNLGNIIQNNFMLYIIISLTILLISLIIYFISKKTKLYQKLIEFTKSVFDTVKKTFRIKKYKRFLILTIFIWICLILMNYTYLLSLPETEGFNFYFAVLILFIGGIGWALPSPGGIGTTHFFILQLFLLFELSENSGLSFGILSNGATFILTIIFGIIAFVLKRIINYVKHKPEV